MMIFWIYWDMRVEQPDIFGQPQIRRPDEWISTGFDPANIGYDLCKDISR